MSEIDPRNVIGNFVNGKADHVTLHTKYQTQDQQIHVSARGKLRSRAGINFPPPCKNGTNYSRDSRTAIPARQFQPPHESLLDPYPY